MTVKVVQCVVLPCVLLFLILSLSPSFCKKLACLTSDDCVKSDESEEGGEELVCLVSSPRMRVCLTLSSSFSSLSFFFFLIE